MMNAEQEKYELHITKKYEMLIGIVILLFMVVFYNNWANLDIIMYLGFLCLLISFLLVLKSNILRTKGELVETGGYATTKFVDSGIYGIIRHPIYLSLFYLFIGLIFVSQHPISILIGFIMTVYCYYLMITEEKLTSVKFGEQYLQYMKRVPRSNIAIGIWRLIIKRIRN